MDFFRRLLLLPGFKDTDVCDIVCNPLKCTRCSFSSTSSVYNFSPPPPPPPPPSHESSPSPVLITVIALLSSFLLLATYYAVIAKLCSSRRISGVSPTQNDPTDQEDSSEATSIGITPANYIWYITTVGLDESVINSIAVCKYKRGEGLVEGSNCTVCLIEFRDDDTLRLLPKCRHAFHIPCIDTWLRSHVNCPLCRTNIMSNPPSSFTTDPNADVSSALGRTQMRISQNNVGLGGDRNEQSMASEVEVDLEREERLDLESLGRASSGVNNGMRILSDLGQIHRYGNREIEMVGDEMQPIRRSASMDSLAPYMICLPFSNIPKNPGDKKQSLCESSGMKGVCCPSNFERYQRFVKVECKGYKWSSLSKVPIAMKRSNSSSAEFVLPRTSR